MQAPSFLLPCPPLDLRPEEQDAFEQVFQSAPPGGFID